MPPTTDHDSPRARGFARPPRPTPAALALLLLAACATTDGAPPTDERLAFLLTKYDRDGDGRVARSEYDRAPTLWQTNNNGRPWRFTAGECARLRRRGAAPTRCGWGRGRRYYRQCVGEVNGPRVLVYLAGDGCLSFSARRYIFAW